MIQAKELIKKLESFIEELKKHPDAIVKLYFDSFDTPQEFFENCELEYEGVSDVDKQEWFSISTIC